ncbi:MAG: hypothetical protein OR997_08710 [Methylophilaceae bacterium]|nr:hypothetical protein [Methylophilaceae bacterium]
MTRLSVKALTLITLALTLLISLFSKANALEFSEHFDGAMRIDGESTWIHADGTFEKGDSKKFERFLEETNIWPNQRIVLNSGGGNVLEGIKIGTFIRKSGFRTAVAKSVKTGAFSEVKPGVCASSCVLAFAGGVERRASTGSRIGVHQMSRDYNNVARGTLVTFADLKSNMSLTQTFIGLILTHYIQMGIDPKIISHMVGTSAEDIRWLTREEFKSTNLELNPFIFSPWNIELWGRGIVAFSRSEDKKKQLTLFCGKDKKMRFLLKIEGKPHFNSYTKHVQLDQFMVAGSKVSARAAKVQVKDNALIISGPWSGSSKPSNYMSIFSIQGEVTGTVSDIYSLYSFNKTNFEQSAELARKNCV